MTKLVIGIIPARMASTRFPGKPLAPLHGMPMIGHVWHRCRMAAVLTGVYVATCDDEIAAYVRSVGGKAIMTDPGHERASDRTAEAVERIEAADGGRVDIVVMVQGDEPMVTPAMVEAAVQPLLEDSAVKVVNLMADLETQEEHEDASEVKVVTDLRGDALYFSREPIPSRQKGAAQVPMRKQVCIIPFERDFLFQYHRLPATPLEAVESVDMLRILEHGYRVRMVHTETRTYAVDTPEDLKFVEQQMLGDALRRHYQ